MDLITAVFQAIGQSITAFAQNLASAFTSITSMFWTPGVGEASGSLTVLGILVLLTAGVSLCVFAFTFIYKLVRRA